MDHEVGPWKMAFINGPSSWSNFYFLEIGFESLGPSLGVNQMWTKKNDHAPKVNMLFFLIHAQNSNFE